MAARAYCHGFLRLSLVSIAVDVFNAEDSKADISFHQIHKPTGKRIHYTKTVEGLGEVAAGEIVSGYEVEKDVNVIMSPDEIDAVRLESKKTLELVQFVKLEDVDPRFLERPYYITPGDEYAAEGYLVIREALKKTGTMGLGQLTASGREHLVGIAPLEEGLMLVRLRYADELKNAGTFFGELPRMRLDHEMVDLATELIERKASRFRPEAFKDHYVVELRKLIQQKAKGNQIAAEPDPEPPRSNVVNLMDALRDSLKSSSGNTAAPARKSTVSKRTTSAKRAAPARRRVRSK